MVQSVYGQVDSNGIYRHYPGFLRLFRYEFDIMLDEASFVKEYRSKLKGVLTPERIAQFAKVIPEDQTSFTRNEDKDEKRNMFLRLRDVKDEHVQFWRWFHDKLIKYVETKQDNRLAMLKEAPKYEKESFDIFFDNSYIPNKLDCVTDALMINEFIEEFQKLHVPAYEELLKNWVIPVNDKHRHSFHYGACVLLRELFYCNPEVVAEKEHSWYHDYLYTCTKNVRSGTMLKYIDKDFASKLDKYVIKLNAPKTNVLGTDEFVDPEEEKTIQFRKPRSKDDYFEIDQDSEGAKLELRNYQRALVQFANDGDNTVICAPTGSGKTIVAIDIIHKHLLHRTFGQDGSITERSRVVFVVPTVPLVAQQQKLIETYLGAGRYVIKGFSGGDHRDLDQRANDILESHVIIITPQMLVNLLQTVNKNRRLYISDFSLFVLDECHHCASKHPYEILMKMVRTFVETNLNGREKPQVVGLTASLGTNRETWNEDKVIEHMLSLCVRMLATQVSTVRSQSDIEELNLHVSPPIDEICPMKRSVKDDFRTVICDLVSKVVDIIRPDVNELIETVARLKEFRFTNPADSSFRNVIARLRESNTSWPDSFENRDKVWTALDYLTIYLHALKLNELVPSQFAFAYMKENYGAYLGKQDNDEYGYRELYEEYEPELEQVSNRDDGKNKPILEKLKSIIETAYEENPSTRTLIFAESRSLTQYLADYLNRCSQLRKFATDGEFTHYLTSTNQARKSGGMSSADQKSILNQFDHGNIKVLIATSVAEEGLDISACNLIIKYNTVGSERTMIQRRGRARARNSRSYLICLDGEIEQRELDNFRRESLMHKCLQHIQAISPKQLESEIEEQRQKMLLREKVKENEDKERNRSLTDHVYELQCAKCWHILCTSDDIRLLHKFAETQTVCVHQNRVGNVIKFIRRTTLFFHELLQQPNIRSVLDSHYCCVQRNIWNNIKIVASDSPSRDDNFIKCDPFCCIGKSDGKNCDNVLGTVIMFADVFLPSIKHASIVLQQKVNASLKRSKDEEPRIDKKKWIDMQKELFLINPITLNNLLEMAPTLQQTSPEDYEQTRLQATYAIQKQIEKIKAKRMRKNRFALAEYDDDEY